MHSSNQGQAARRFDSSRFDAGYDCELPPDVRTELFAPRRPRILGRKTSPGLNPAAKWPLYLVLLIAIVVVGGTIATWRQEQNTERTNKAISQPLAPQPTPTPVPTPELSPYRDWQSYLAAQQQRAPRAALVKLPPPRAHLISLPEWKAGETRPVTMPYNLEMLAIYKGRLPSEDMLPQR
jgi:hypothetical protein